MSLQSAEDFSSQSEVGNGASKVYLVDNIRT